MYLTTTVHIGATEWAKAKVRVHDGRSMLCFAAPDWPNATELLIFGGEHTTPVPLADVAGHLRRLADDLDALDVGVREMAEASGF